MAENDDFELTDELRRAGDAIAGLPRDEAPPGLAARTVARVTSECRSIRWVFWLLRPITHPLARVAAAALIVLVLFPMTSVNLASPLGTRIEERIIGRKMADRIEGLVDTLLVQYGPRAYAEKDPDAFMGVYRYDAPRREPVRLNLNYRADDSQV